MFHAVIAILYIYIYTLLKIRCLINIPSGCYIYVASVKVISSPVGVFIAPHAGVFYYTHAYIAWKKSMHV